MRNYYSLNDQFVTLKPLNNSRRVLDICLGGESIISRVVSGEGVVISPDEEILKAADSKSLKVLMNPANMTFFPESFDVVTCFFSFLYLSKYRPVFVHINRVIERWGRLLIWDCTVPKRISHKTFFAIPLIVDTGLETIRTVHVIRWNKEQSIGLFKKIARETGFKIVTQETYDQVFHLELIKVGRPKHR